jgi:hypothetical protein
VHDLAGRADLPMPRVYLMDNPQPNAFATGRDPEHSAVAVTTGLLDRLNRDEVAGVIAHELAHIKNRDTLIMTITATIAGAISMLAQFGMFFGGGNRDNNGGFGIVGTLAMVILAPIAAMLVQMAVSRTREYAADNEGGRIVGRPMGAGLGAGQDRERRRADSKRHRGAKPGDRASVHRQSADGRPRLGQSVRNPSGGREPHRGASTACNRAWRRRADDECATQHSAWPVTWSFTWPLGRRAPQCVGHRAPRSLGLIEMKPPRDLAARAGLKSRSGPERRLAVRWQCVF